MNEIELNHQIIATLYKCLLGRYPESAEVVLGHLNFSKTVDELIAKIKSSDEYVTSGAASYIDVVGRNYWARADDQSDSTDKCSVEIVDALFQRLQRQWKLLGSTEPYWSVLSSDSFQMTNFEHHRAQFFASGYENLRLIHGFFSRNGIPMPSGICLELGCGVGRVTIPLSTIFQKVIGLDVSEGNLALCRKHIAAEGRTNAESCLVVSPSDYESLPKHDFFFSFIVLQHNPPPLQEYILGKILGKTNPGGVCLFQMATNTPNYRFDIAEFLAQPSGVIDMHSLPMKVVFSLLHQHGFRLLEVINDPWTGLYGSHTFFAIKDNS